MSLKASVLAFVVVEYQLALATGQAGWLRRSSFPLIFQSPEEGLQTKTNFRATARQPLLPSVQQSCHFRLQKAATPFLLSFSFNDQSTQSLASLLQVCHDVSLQKLPVRFAMDRAGLVGADGPTHAGAFDVTYMLVVTSSLHSHSFLLEPETGSALLTFPASFGIRDCRSFPACHHPIPHE